MISDAYTAPLVHGGDLDAARRLFPGAQEPFVDLSTGINPYPYPMPQLSSDVQARLPGAAAVSRLAAVAARAHGAPSSAHVVAAPGTQILLPQVAGLIPPGRAAVLGPTYAEHARAATVVGHDVKHVTEIAQLADADLAIVVNPNNPDVRIVDRASLLALAGDLAPRGLLVVDEAFMDVCDPGMSLAGDVGRGNIVVLRSFGKFFGLAGLRLGFALAAPEIVTRLSALLGPWAVSGPALVVGEIALADTSWAVTTRIALAQAAQRLDDVLTAGGLEIVGGTSLFRLARASAAAELFDHLGRAGILVRRFAEQPTWLRFGLPATTDAWSRLKDGLGAFRQG